MSTVFRRGVTSLVACLSLSSLPTQAASATDGEILREAVLRGYPSLDYVDRYRAGFPAEVLGGPFWRTQEAAEVTAPQQVIAALAGLADQHVVVSGPGGTETLGVLFRTADDASMIVWRVWSAEGLREGEQVLAIDGVPARTWLERAAGLTFAGHRRGRQAEAATELGVGTAVAHKVRGLGNRVRLRLRTQEGTVHETSLPFVPMDEAHAAALARAVGRSDLPEALVAPSLRIGAVRIGAFDPQYDPAFEAAADRAAKEGADDDKAMLAGMCAEVGDFIRRYDTIASQSNVMVLDLRGNLGGFDRFARLTALALAPKPLPHTFDFVRGSKPGTLRLTEQHTDAPCGHVAAQTPLAVLDDAATRSSGEFMAAWLWAAGVFVAGEQTLGAGGGRSSDAKGFLLPASGLRIKLSDEFAIIDPEGRFRDGEWPEETLLDEITADGFSPSRQHPFMFQSVGVRPDEIEHTTLADLKDSGRAEMIRAVRAALAAPAATGSRPRP